MVRAPVPHLETFILPREVFVTSIDHIADVIEIGGCVVIGIGVAPERYRILLQDSANQDYLVIGAKDSVDADFIASRMSGENLKPKSIVILEL